MGNGLADKTGGSSKGNRRLHKKEEGGGYLPWQICPDKLRRKRQCWN